MPEELKNQETQVTDEDEQFINSLLGADEDEEEAKKAEEAQRIKNKNAEEARKRREAEAKAKKDQESDEPEEEVETQEVEAKEDVEEPKEEAKEEPKVEEPKEENVNQLGKQLVNFKQKYPQVDLEQLDQDKTFKRYIDGKLLGSKDFTTLYEEFVEMKAELQGVEANSVQRNYMKAQSSSGTSTSTSTTTGDIFSEEEMRKLSQRIPLMNPRDVAKIEEKLNRSIAYYESK